MTYEIRMVIDDDGWATEHVSFHATEAEAETEAERLTLREGYDCFQVRAV